MEPLAEALLELAMQLSWNTSLFGDRANHPPVQDIAKALETALKGAGFETTYWLYVDAKDGVDTIPLVPEPLPLPLCTAAIIQRCHLWQKQGYYLNCKQERIPIGELAFRLVPDLSE